MWRLVVVASVLLTLALGTIAEGKCQVCVESVKAARTDGGMTLRFTARAVHAPTLPETGTAVVMQVDGNRSKCINVSLRKVEETGGVATYAGSLTSFYGNATFTGRVDIAGDIHEFTAPLDGKPGTLQLVTAATAGQVTSTATTAPSTAPTAVPRYNTDWLSDSATIADSRPSWTRRAVCAGWNDQPAMPPMTNPHPAMAVAAADGPMLAAAAKAR